MYIMDINHNNNTGGLDMTIDGSILQDQLPYDLILPNYHLQPHQIPSSSHIPSSSFPIDQLGTQREEQEEPEEELGAMKEMMYKIAAMQPVDIDPAMIAKPKRRNVRISNDPQSVAARHRRERISERIRILQRLVPGGMKMDTATMLDEAIRYVKFLKRQVQELQSDQHMPNIGVAGHLMGDGLCVTTTTSSSSSVQPPVGAGFTIGGGDIPI